MTSRETYHIATLARVTPAARWRLPSRQVLVTAALLVASLLVLGFIAPNFFRYNNITNVLLQTSLLGSLAIGMSVVMIVGGKIDLSLPANMAMSAILGALYMKATGDWIVGSLIMMGPVPASGRQRMAVAWLKMISLRRDSSMMTVVSGTAVGSQLSQHLSTPEYSSTC